MDKSQDLLFKRYALNLLYVTLLFFALGYLLFFVNNLFRSFFLIILAIHTFGIIAFHMIPSVHARKLISIYYFILLAILYPLTVYDLLEGSVDLLFWWIPSPVILYTFYPGKKGIRLAGWCFGVLLSAFALTFILRYALYHNAPLDFHFSLSLALLIRAAMMSVACVLLMVWAGLHHLNELRQIEKDEYQMEIKRLQEIISDGGDKRMRDRMEADMEEKERNRRIFVRIQEFFETKKPYLNANLTLSQCANELGTNTLYLSKAINEVKEINFNVFVNSYRIAEAKELMRNNLRKYSLQYIYLSSGFKSQPAFNRAFKDIEGVTPSEYYKKLENNSTEG